MLSFNRTILFCALIVFFVGFILNRAPKTMLLIFTAFAIFIPFILDFILSANIETVNSRVLLSQAVWNSMKGYTAYNTLMGEQSLFSTEVRIGDVFTLSNIENGFLFFLRFFGISGVLFYVF
ncbi:hypothetical protein, partial [Aeromonas salmonicida]|uniref:hypothetical protein n=1 Tax=Aeromonas salmonicida TaxID=645 RepID=UPI0035A6C0F7